MHLEIDRVPAGRFQWCLAGEDGHAAGGFRDGLRLRADARRAAADVRLHAGSAGGTEES